MFQFLKILSLVCCISLGYSASISKENFEKFGSFVVQNKNQLTKNLEKVLSMPNLEALYEDKDPTKLLNLIFDGCNYNVGQLDQNTLEREYYQIINSELGGFFWDEHRELFDDFRKYAQRLDSLVKNPREFNSRNEIDYDINNTIKYVIEKMEKPTLSRAQEKNSAPSAEDQLNAEKERQLIEEIMQRVKERDQSLEKMRQRNAEKEMQVKEEKEKQLIEEIMQRVRERDQRYKN